MILPEVSRTKAGAADDDSLLKAGHLRDVQKLSLNELRPGGGQIALQPGKKYRRFYQQGGIRIPWGGEMLERQVIKEFGLGDHVPRDGLEIRRSLRRIIEPCRHTPYPCPSFEEWVVKERRRMRSNC